MKIGDLVKYKHKDGVGIITRIKNRPDGDNIFVMWSLEWVGSHKKLGWFVHPNWIESVSEDR